MNAETAVVAPPAGRSLSLLGREFSLVLPTRRDPRWRLAAVIVSLQVLGQTVLNFKVSIAQILVTIAFCGVVEVTVTAWRSGVLLWPGSAMLTGNSTSFILRAAGTKHGDWWSLNGIEFFLFAAAVAMLSKYLIRPGGRHIYNPSNIGLVACFLIVGAPKVFPQYLWWGPLEGPVIAALVVIALGALWVSFRLRMLPMVAAFSVAFGALVAGLAVAGRCFAAIWVNQPVCGEDYWTKICLSPELLIFVLFMMSDPRTSPETVRWRMVYGILTAVAAAALMAPQQTEYGVKVAILGSLTLTCTLVPLLRWAWHNRGVRKSALARQLPRSGAAIVAAALIALAVPVGVIQMAGDERILDIERAPSIGGAVSQ